MSETMSDSRALRPIDEIRQTFDRMVPQIKAALPPHIPVERFVRIVMTSVQSNPKLIDVARHTLYGAAIKSAQDGLLPDGKEAVILEYNVNVGTRDNPKWEKHAQYQPMAEGLLKKVRNSGELGNISVQVVKENDEFVYELGDNPRIEHKVPPLGKPRGGTVGAYSIATLKSGEKSREVMDIEQIEAVRARSKSKDSGPWKTDYDEMCRKTVFRRHYKRLPKSTDLDGVIQHDDDAFDMEREERQAGPVDLSPPPTTSTEATDKPKRPKALEKVAKAGNQGKAADPVQDVEVKPAGTPPPASAAADGPPPGHPTNAPDDVI